MSITTITAFANQQHLAAQEVAKEAPPQAAAQTVQQEALPDLPMATIVPVDDGSFPLTIEADKSSRYGNVDRLEGSVVITYRGHAVRADRITYDAATGEVIAEGNVLLTGGDNDEYMEASHAMYNLNTQTGRFYDVSGSVGMHATVRTANYSPPNPFLFSGKLVVKTGPENYDVYDGKVTSCLLPNPDWQLTAGHFALNSTQARAYKSTFRLLNVPVLFLPYVTHPLGSEQRQSGFLIPSGDPHSSTKGTVIGEQVYFALNRSSDLTLGLQFFSSRGFSESGTFRYRGLGTNFVTAHFSALQDRGIVLNKILTDQGGQDVTFAFRHKLTSRTRVVGDAEYLSSYVYREAFNESFNQAVSSDITSVLYAVNQQYGFSTAVRADRYQGLKRVPIGTQPGQQVRIFHAPSIDFTAVDHHLGTTPLLWSLTSSVAGLKRTQPNFISSGMIERLDLRPELSLPLAGGGWHSLSSIAVRETVYSRSRAVPYVTPAPVELTEPINRASVEMQVDLRAPVIERTFSTPKALAGLLGPEVRHTVEPQFVYRNVRGIDNFLGVLRFDDVDVASNTNELEYGVTQRLFARRRAAKVVPCAAKTKPARPSAAQAALPDAPSHPAEAVAEVPEAAIEPEVISGIDANGIPIPDVPAAPTRSHAHVANPCPQPEAPQQEWVSWRVAQRHFFDPTFGGAVINTRRNIFDSTLSFSGIAFLTEGRDTSPLISRLRLRTSSHTDVEWDFDLDTGAKRFTSNNIFLDAHEGPYFGAISYARLNAPGRFYTESIDTNTLISSPVSNFQQMRVLLGYGTASKPGLSLAANANLDLNLGSLQYGAMQASYNWNCCGFSVEYRKYELGSVRNEGTERFSFTLVNIGTAGNLRKAERLF